MTNVPHSPVRLWKQAPVGAVDIPSCTLLLFDKKEGAKSSPMIMFAYILIFVLFIIAVIREYRK